MLAITRAQGEGVVIGDPNNPIGRVKVTRIKGDRVRVAFDFPRDIPVHRDEIAFEITNPGRRGTPRTPRPAVAVAPDPREPKIPRRMTLSDKHWPILLWVSGLSHAVGADDLAAKMEAAGWSEAARDELIDLGLLARDDAGAVRPTDSIGTLAARKYGRWVRG